MNKGPAIVSADLVFAPEPEPKPDSEQQRIDWAHRPADDALARIIDAAITGDNDH